MVSVSPFWWMVPLQVGWLSIPFWFSASRRRRMRKLAAKHGFGFENRGLPASFPAQALLEGKDPSEARNIVFGAKDGDEFLAFDFGGDRNHRPQTHIARRRIRAGGGLGDPPPGYWSISLCGQWAMAVPNYTWLTKIVQGVIEPAEIEFMWRLLC